MIRFIITPLIALSMGISCYAQKTLNVEEQTIQEYKKDSLSYDFIASLSVIDSTVTVEDIASYSRQLDYFIENLPPKEQKSKKEKKRIRYIYEEAHETFFSKYEDIAYFPQIFKDGVYNCVTATALYSYVFDSIDVPYAIKDAPGHVYMIAYPQTHKIILETTAPGVYGFRTPKDSEVRDQVNQLVEFKLITPQEVASKGESKVFMDYFYGKNQVQKAALVGMQYYNRSLEFYEKEEFENALKEIKKSLVFYPYTPSEFLYRGLVGLSLEEMEFNTTEDVMYLVDMFNTLTYGTDYQKTQVQYYIYQILQHDDNDIDFIDDIASRMGQIKNEQVRKITKEMLYEYIARKSGDNAETELALRASDSVLVYNPKSKIAKEIIAFAVGRKMASSNLDSEAIHRMDTLYSKYHFLEGNIKIESVRAYLYARMASNTFRSKEPARAQMYLTDFEKLMDTYGDKLEIITEIPIQLYLQAGRYYYSRSINKQALDLFEKGLEYAPENPDLEKMARWAREDLN